MKQGRVEKGAELSITTLFLFPYTGYFVQDQQAVCSKKENNAGTSLRGMCKREMTCIENTKKRPESKL